MLKIKTVINDSENDPNIQNPSVTREIQYRPGMMRRRDAIGDGTGSVLEDITNCETRTGYLVEPDTHEYKTYKVVRFFSEAQRAEYLKQVGRGAVPVESKTIDTGERRMFFGHSARHLITTTKLAAAGNRGGEETIDGWYIDREGFDRSCAPDFVRSEPYYVVGTGLVEYPDIGELRHTGPLPTGLAVSAKMTFKHPGAKTGAPDRVITIEKTVEELSDSPLNPSLFELPTGFHENPHLFQGHTFTSAQSPSAQ